LVRSIISSRSNSANAAKIPNTSRPLAVVVSMLAPCPVSTVIERQASIQAWIVDDTGFPKKGRHSVGVGLVRPH